MKDKIMNSYETTELTLQEIADTLGSTYKIVWSIIAKNYSKEYRAERKRKSYQNSKQGIKNPMFGKFAEQHHLYKSTPKSDCKGYLLQLKPKWYTGRVGSKHIFFHNLVMCESLGITEVPKGWAVHHVDNDPYNNDINNLALLRTSAHLRLHQRERATTRAKARTLEANASGSAPQSEMIDDIV